jgi:hypothetical protein
LLAGLRGRFRDPNKGKQHDPERNMRGLVHRSPSIAAAAANQIKPVCMTIRRKLATAIKMCGSPLTHTYGSVQEIDRLIGKLETLRDRLQREADRVQRQIAA